MLHTHTRCEGKARDKGETHSDVAERNFGYTRTQSNLGAVCACVCVRGGGVDVEAIDLQHRLLLSARDSRVCD